VSHAAVASLAVTSGSKPLLKAGYCVLRKISVLFSALLREAADLV